MTKQTSNPGPEAAAATSEMERIFREGTDLERQGKLDADAIERIDAQMRAVSARLDQDLAEKLAEIDARYTQPNSGSPAIPVKLPKSIAWLLFAALLLAVAGGLLEVTIGRGFIFAHANGYRDAMPLVLFILIPAFALLWFPLIKNNPHMLSRYPTGVIRWGVMFPLTAVMSAAMIVVAPLGWIALCGWAVGEPSSIVEARVISIQTYRKGCKLKAEIEIHGNSADVCLGGRVAGRIPEAGDTITVQGKTSFLGVYVDEIRTN